MVIKLDKKTIQKRRIMGYFIDAAHQIIESEGIERVTIREVSDIAGYNSATLYNYFENLDHLIFYSSLKYLYDYVQNLNDFIRNAKNSLDKYLKIWGCFCYHSFNKPMIYNAIFFNKYSTKLNYDIKEYYSIFPEELGDQEDDIKPMLLGQNIYERNLTILKSCIRDGFIKEEDAEAINEMIILIYQGMINRIIIYQTNCSVNELTDRTLAYIKQVLKSYGSKVE